MTTSRVSSALSRRRFVQGASAVAGAAATGAAVAPVRATDNHGTATTLVAATVVRASHARNTPGALSLGVRVSILSPTISTDRFVVVVDEIPFGASANEMSTRIAEGVRREVLALLHKRGETARPEEIAVQVFGGAL